MELPKNCGNASKALELEKDKNYAWCSCGLSKSQPLCDGAHRSGSGMKSLVFQAERSGTQHLCMCKQTKNPPYCDGTHRSL
ncbi:MAG: CDGSH iron-sulfur domain-containing protein [Flavicella sp.]|nr:CDGSH iron-sulfur domain-containing protein [Flavicella sp.]